MIIKICGIKTMAAAKSVQESGADLLGFVFAPSKRYIDPEEAAVICSSVPEISKVGVFVDSPLEVVQRIARLCRLNYVQLHGSESPEYCHAVGIPVIKAFRTHPGLTAEEVNRFSVEYVLLDSYVPGQAGGTGQTMDWQSIRNRFAEIRSPLLLAGGLTKANIITAITAFRPDGVDVSGGVESNGSKDIAKIKEFVQTVRAGFKEG